MKRKAVMFLADDSAVSNAIAGVLTFALIVMVLIVVRTEFVPVWEKDREAALLGTVQREFLQLTAESERQAADRTGRVAVTTPITLSETERARFFSGSGLPGALEFDPRAGQPSNLSSDELLIFSEDGEDHFGIDEDWTEIKDKATVEDIERIQHLRIRVNNPGLLSGPPHGNDKGGVTLTIRDADDLFAGDIRVYVQSHPSGYNVNTKVRDAASTVLYDQGTAHFSQDTPEQYWVNALSDERQFDSVIAKAKTPISVQWTQNLLTGSYTMSYIMAGGDGNDTVQVGGSGLLVEDWESEQGGGKLAFRSQNRYYLDQKLHLEHGAVILEQPDGAVMVGTPHFEPKLVSGKTAISFTSIGYVGLQNDAGSGRAVAVELFATDHVALSAGAASFTWDHPTGFPTVWADFWRDRLVAAGLDEGSGHFTIVTQADRVTLTVHGTDTDPTSDARDLSLTIRQSTLRVVLPS